MSGKGYRVVGSNVKRKEGAQKACGTSKYIDDMEFPDMVYVSIRTAGVAHGIIKAIDTEPAGRMDGVIDIITADDIPGENQMGEVVPDYPALLKPGDKAVYVGDYVAYVAAETPEQAR